MLAGCSVTSNWAAAFFSLSRAGFRNRFRFNSVLPLPRDLRQRPRLGSFLSAPSPSLPALTLRGAGNEGEGVERKPLCSEPEFARHNTPMPTPDDHTLMAQAIDLSIHSVSTGGGPFGCVIAKDGLVIATGTNQVTRSNDPTAHAEIVAIRAACQALGTFTLRGCQVFTSCEPCPMCLAGLWWARVDQIVYANTRSDAADIGFDDKNIYAELTQPPRRTQAAAAADDAGGGSAGLHRLALESGSRRVLKLFQSPMRTPAWNFAALDQLAVRIPERPHALAQPACVIALLGLDPVGVIGGPGAVAHAVASHRPRSTETPFSCHHNIGRDRGGSVKLHSERGLPSGHAVVHLPVGSPFSKKRSERTTPPGYHSMSRPCGTILPPSKRSTCHSRRGSLASAS